MSICALIRFPEARFVSFIVMAMSILAIIINFSFDVLSKECIYNKSFSARFLALLCMIVLFLASVFVSFDSQSVFFKIVGIVFAFAMLVAAIKILSDLLRERNR